MPSVARCELLAPPVTCPSRTPDRPGEMTCGQQHGPRSRAIFDRTEPRALPAVKHNSRNCKGR